MEDQLILTIDVGSSSVRASLYDRMGRYVNGTEAQLSYSFKTISDDGAKVDADGLVDLPHALSTGRSRWRRTRPTG